MANSDETPVSLEPLSKQTIELKGKSRAVARCKGRRKENITVYLSYTVEIKVGKDEEDDDGLLFGRVVCFRPTIIFKGEIEGRVHKECKRINRSVPCVVCTVSESAKSTERTMLFGIKEGTRGLLEEASYSYTVDGAPCHMHTCICALLLSFMLYMYVSPPNTTPYRQGCDKVQINQSFDRDVEEQFCEWVLPISEKLSDKDPVPASERRLMVIWIRDAWERIFDEKILRAMKQLIFQRE